MDRHYLLLLYLLTLCQATIEACIIIQQNEKEDSHHPKSLEILVILLFEKSHITRFLNIESMRDKMTTDLFVGEAYHSANDRLCVILSMTENVTVV